jgi:hypothetical protein
MWNKDLIQIQQYYETLITLRGRGVTYKKGRVKEGNKEDEYG